MFFFMFVFSFMFSVVCYRVNNSECGIPGNMLLGVRIAGVFHMSLGSLY